MSITTYPNQRFLTIRYYLPEDTTYATQYLTKYARKSTIITYNALLTKLSRAMQGEREYPFFSIEIAKQTNYTEKTIKLAMQQLRDLGFIKPLSQLSNKREILYDLNDELIAQWEKSNNVKLHLTSCLYDYHRYWDEKAYANWLGIINYPSLDPKVISGVITENFLINPGIIQWHLEKGYSIKDLDERFLHVWGKGDSIHKEDYDSSMPPSWGELSEEMLPLLNGYDDGWEGAIGWKGDKGNSGKG